MIWVTGSSGTTAVNANYATIVDYYYQPDPIEWSAYERAKESARVAAALEPQFRIVKARIAPAPRFIPPRHAPPPRYSFYQGEF